MRPPLRRIPTVTPPPSRVHVERVPAKPTPAEPTPAKPAPVEPAPVEPAPVEPAPATPTLVKPTSAKTPAPTPAKAPAKRSAHRPLYPRLLRLQHVHPNAWQRAVLGEGMALVGGLLAMADLASAWTILALPAAVAVMVKANDLLAGALVDGDQPPGEA